MGSLSFGISEIINEPVYGWFKLLNHEEGEYYNIRIPPEDDDEVEMLRRHMQELQQTKQQKLSDQQQQLSNQRIFTNDELTSTISEINNKEVIKAADFNFLTVLGKGSFGKVVFKKNK